MRLTIEEKQIRGDFFLYTNCTKLWTEHAAQVRFFPPSRRQRRDTARSWIFHHVVKLVQRYAFLTAAANEESKSNIARRLLQIHKTLPWESSLQQHWPTASHRGGFEV